MEPPPPRMHSRASRSVHSTAQSFTTSRQSARAHTWDDMSSRPKSMSDFQSLIDASTPLNALNGQGLPRKKPSISLAAGLMMTSDSPRHLSHPTTPAMAHHPPSSDGPWSENLFYAYAQKSDYAQSAPYIVTFASALVAEQWWALVQREYPESTRPGPQLFILKGDDMQEQIQDNPKFYDLRNSWFYTPSDGATAPIPLQDYHGNPVAVLPGPKAKEEKAETGGFNFQALEATLEKMAAMVTENTESIRALSVAQSTGLQTMQEINESTSTQIKALADNQAALQAIVDQNASHYIALSNSSFGAQSSMQNVLQSNAKQIESLASGQKKLVKTCADMMHSVEKVGEAMKEIGSDTASNASVMRETEKSIGTIVNRIQPPPRKLNRRIKGVWYEYDDHDGGGGPVGASPPPTASSMESMSPTPPPMTGMPMRRKSVKILDTPPKSPMSARTA